ncbi:phosphotransferase [Flammeovirga yaeyamensis]|uniref:Phosphotransferase n=1 Tax=Flammeovirga yaeyamensis TaxID=367791 RepID=A0AAX1N960_9BACT|nr:phosphotransferase [Flammeovirga yaeyamensis]MBB3698923.1 Ser/Thr protein kinase RdoA (MazF antagonist) [Flammeovirga yaeyamensis]NMF36358.1 phosphotransferase [Flammeovirga yaeyamensis]QWG03681.1 phosphotransferase [Flammeovirga yaeyamensis]
MNKLNEIFYQFLPEFKVNKIAKYGSGHINDTYMVTIDDSETTFIMQRVNHQIFPNVPELMNNIFGVTNHLKTKFEEMEGKDPNVNSLTFINTLDGEKYHQDEEGNYWRVMETITPARSYDKVETEQQAFQAGVGIGEFQALLSDFDGSSLYEIIPNFHNMETRLATFREIVKKDVVGRVRLAQEQIQFVENRAEEMQTLVRLGKEGKLPIRVTHNDTKINNVLLDENDEVLCVIDLDTVMPGFVLYDFGDAIRTSTNTGDEDDANLDNVEMDIKLFTAYTKGFLSKTASSLTPIEIEYLPLSARIMTFIIGLRFITDYLDGDNYFKTHHEHHNLQRAKAQFKLVSSMERQFEEMQRVVQEEVTVNC